jgi:hypothetical protein
MQGRTKAIGCSVADAVSEGLEKRKGGNKQQKNRWGVRLARAVSERRPAMRRSTLFWDWSNSSRFGFHLGDGGELLTAPAIDMQIPSVTDKFCCNTLLDCRMLYNE